ncbi:thermopsin precursor, partial [mine drainage metagenome]
MTLNGVAMSSATSTIAFTEPNGTYAYAITDVPGWHQTTLPYAGMVTVDGAPVNEPTLDFSQVSYSVAFTETGLRSGTSWSATVNGAAKGSTTSTIIFTEPNGTYAYTLGGVPGWTTSGFSGSVMVSGAAIAVTVRWAQVTYAVTF